MKTKSCENSMKIIKKHDEITCQTLAYMIKFICCKKTRMRMVCWCLFNAEETEMCRRTFYNKRAHPAREVYGRF